MNTQPIEKRTNSLNGELEVHSVFRTIQGEGPFCGTPCVFVRLAGCNLACEFCDTDYTTRRMFYSVTNLVNRVQELREKGLVVITGGEPFRQNILPFIRDLIHHGYYVQVETNGTLPFPNCAYSYIPSNKRGLYIVLSPKTQKVNKDAFNLACCVKYVIDCKNIREEDGLPITVLNHPCKTFVARPPTGWDRPIYVQPMDVPDDLDWTKENIKAATHLCLENGYTLQLQIHKIIGLE